MLTLGPVPGAAEEARSAGHSRGQSPDHRVLSSGSNIATSQLVTAEDRAQTIVSYPQVANIQHRHSESRIVVFTNKRSQAKVYTVYFGISSV